MTDVNTLDDATAAELAAGSLYVFDPSNPGQQTKTPAQSLIASGVRTAAGTTDTLVLGDTNGIVRYSNAGAITATIPPEASVAFPIGTFVEIHQIGAGTVSVEGGSGVTLNSRGALFDTAGQYAVVGIRKVAADTWVLTGDLA